MSTPASGPVEPEHEPDAASESEPASVAPELTPPSASEVIGGALAQAARRAGIDPTMQQSAGHVVWAAIGGIRGILSAVLPRLGFVVTHPVTYNPGTD